MWSFFYLFAHYQHDEKAILLIHKYEIYFWRWIPYNLQFTIPINKWWKAGETSIYLVWTIKPLEIRTWEGVGSHRGLGHTKVLRQLEPGKSLPWNWRYIQTHSNSEKNLPENASDWVKYKSTERRNAKVWTDYDIQYAPVVQIDQSNSGTGMRMVECSACKNYLHM